MKTDGQSASEDLRLLLERIDTLEDEKQEIADDIKDVYAEAKAKGYDTRTMRAIHKLRRLSPEHRAEADALLETYRASLGLL